MSAEQWQQVSRVMDYILAQPSGRIIAGVDTPPKKRTKPKPKKEKPREIAQQLRMF